MVSIHPRSTSEPLTDSDIGVGRKLRNIVEEACARPDCTLHSKSASENQATYFVERLIGRIPSESGVSMYPPHSRFMWLFKWHGFVSSYISCCVQ